MAEKSADSITKLGSIGDWSIYLAVFSDNDLDDNDTWDTGLQTVPFHFCQQTTEGPDDFCFDANSAGTLTYAGKANNTGYVLLIGKDY